MLTVLATIWVLHVAALLSPGANALLISQLAASNQKTSAYYATFGITLGSTIWSVSAVLGVHTLFIAFPALRLSIQIIGGLYLVYIASRLWRSSASFDASSVKTKSKIASFRLGFITNITNPKVALFYGSVFAASFPAAPALGLQIAAVVMVIANAFFWHVLLVSIFSNASINATYSRAGKSLTRISAAAVGMVGIGILVATLREVKK